MLRISFALSLLVACGSKTATASAGSRRRGPSSVRKRERPPRQFAM